MGGDLRVGVVGCGARGGLARLAHAPGRGSRVVGVGEPVPRRQDAAREALDTDGRWRWCPTSTRCSASGWTR